MSIVAVDDCPIMRERLQDLLGASTAPCFEEGLHLVANLQPAVIVLDIMIRGSRRNAFDMVRQFKRTCRKAVVILMTSYFVPELIEQAVARGALTCVPKVDMELLSSVVFEAARQAAAGFFS